MGKEVSFDRWHSDVVGICGDFEGVVRKNHIAVSGGVVSHDFDGLVVADISGEIGAVVRNLGRIRRAGQKHIYCLILAAGQLSVDHNCKNLLLRSGDRLLLDPIRECAMTFVNAGRFLLLQMPRSQLLGSGDDTIRIGHLLPADHPLAPAIRQQIQHCASGWDSGASVGRANSELVLGMIRFAFSKRADFARDLGGECKDRQFVLALELIVKNLTSPELSLAWLWRQVGMSSRQLQRMFGFENTSFSGEVRDRRLNVAAQRLRGVKTARRIQISEMAYDAGFRDLSNFNRGFKSRFGMAPSEYIQTVA